MKIVVKMKTTGEMTTTKDVEPGIETPITEAAGAVEPATVLPVVPGPSPAVRTDNARNPHTGTVHFTIGIAVLTNL
jgi:hypothetical protein